MKHYITAMTTTNSMVLVACRCGELFLSYQGGILGRWKRHIGVTEDEDG